MCSQIQAYNGSPCVPVRFNRPVRYHAFQFDGCGDTAATLAASAFPTRCVDVPAKLPAPADEVIE